MLRRALTLAAFAVTGLITLIVQMVTERIPSLWVLIPTAIFVGAAWAYPVLVVDNRAACGDCGSPEPVIDFCLACGSDRVWQAA